MAKHKVYVGNVPWRAKGERLQKHFANFGECTIQLLKNTKTGRPYAIVEYLSRDGLEAACEKLDGQDFMGRELIVHEWEDTPPRRDRDDDY